MGMLVSVRLDFTPWLGAGDGMAFAVICLASGLHWALILALPGALLTGVIHEEGEGGLGEGRYLGWWTCATKLNLALAAGLALPLLSAGYRSGGTDPPGCSTGLGLWRPAMSAQAGGCAPGSSDGGHRVLDLEPDGAVA